MVDLKEVLEHPVYKNNVANKTLYQMDGDVYRWKLVYYPIFSNYDGSEVYEEPRALMQNIDKPGFWNKETPLRYLKKLV